MLAPRNPTRIRLLKVVVPLLLVALTIAVFDFAAWFLLPDSYTAFSHAYRKKHLLEPGSTAPGIARPYPRHYFRVDDSLGSDIAPGARAIHQFSAIPHEIFANQLGCFDRNELADLQGSDYYYFGGDSFTWGYAEYESKYATVWERLTATRAAKCGVTHTGQRHQFGKFKRIAAAIGAFPKIAFVGYVPNDPANDAAHPHTTVVAGYQVDTAYFRDGAIVHPDVQEIRRTVEEALRELEKPLDFVGRVKATIWVYSLSANILNHMRLALENAGRQVPGVVLPDARQRATAKFGDSLYSAYPVASMKQGYERDPATAANRAAIQEWVRHARDHSYRLVFLLFPPKASFNDPDFFASVRRWLDESGVEYLDFAEIFAREKLRREDLYWSDNGHWHSDGNRVVGRLLAARYPERPVTRGAN